MTVVFTPSKPPDASLMIIKRRKPRCWRGKKPFHKQQILFKKCSPLKLSHYPKFIICNDPNQELENQRTNVGISKTMKNSCKNVILSTQIILNSNNMTLKLKC